MNILYNTKIYIECIAEMHSGGPELLHQLCFALRQRDIEAYIFYIPNNLPNPVHPYYKKYHVPYVRTIEDNLENILIVPETATNFLYPVKNIRKVIWWLSVDNWLLHVETLVSSLRKNKFTQKVQPFFYFEKNLEITHLVQSEYAKQFLLLNEVKAGQIHYLSDYLNPLFVQNSKKNFYQPKENIIAFNPKKGYDFTQKLISYDKNLKWVPIINMSPEEIATLLAKAKVYIDFGNHPGKDRIPREAAISGCCIITSKNGSANYPEDVPIGEQYKFDDNDGNIQQIIHKIKFILKNYEAEVENFETYRAAIQAEREIFENDVNKLFSVSSKKKQRRAKVVILTLSEQSGYLLNLLQVSEKYDVLYVVDQRHANKRLNYKNQMIEIISFEDAAWLYGEGRIDKLFLPSLQDKFAEYKVVSSLTKLHVASEDIVFVPIDAILNDHLSIQEKLNEFIPYKQLKE